MTAVDRYRGSFAREERWNPSKVLHIRQGECTFPYHIEGLYSLWSYSAVDRTGDFLSKLSLLEPVEVLHSEEDEPPSPLEELADITSCADHRYAADIDQTRKKFRGLLSEHINPRRRSSSISSIPIEERPASAFKGGTERGTTPCRLDLPTVNEENMNSHPCVGYEWEWERLLNYDSVDFTAGSIAPPAMSQVGAISPGMSSYSSPDNGFNAEPLRVVTQPTSQPTSQTEEQKLEGHRANLNSLLERRQLEPNTRAQAEQELERVEEAIKKSHPKCEYTNEARQTDPQPNPQSNERPPSSFCAAFELARAQSTAVKSGPQQGMANRPLLNRTVASWDMHPPFGTKYNSRRRRRPTNRPSGQDTTAKERRERAEKYYEIINRIDSGGPEQELLNMEFWDPEPDSDEDWWDPEHFFKDLDLVNPSDKGKYAALEQWWSHEHMREKFLAEDLVRWDEDLVHIRWIIGALANKERQGNRDDILEMSSPEAESSGSDVTLA